MKELSRRVHAHFTGTESRFRTERIIVSTSEECGEGEHKMFRYIRSQSIEPGENAAVYGLDSDLIMLSIFHCRLFQNLFIFREAPEFIKSSVVDETIASIEDKKECYFMDISKLSTSVLNEMQCGVSDVHRIYDYVFLCFFLGNDFLPHFPALNIRTNGIHILLDAYRRHLGNHTERFFISRSMQIQWKWVHLFLGELAKNEHDYLLSEYSLRYKWNKRRWLTDTPENRDFTFQSIPVIYRAEENYICPSEKYWEQRYYNSLFTSLMNSNGSPISPDSVLAIDNICVNYLEGLEWVFKYYTVDCPQWRWRYRYHYPPLLADLYKHVPKKECDLICDTNSEHNIPFSSNVQLLYVLPKSNHRLLPEKIQTLILDPKYAEFFAEDVEFKWAFCRYFWEAHADLPEISIDVLDSWENKFSGLTN